MARFDPSEWLVEQARITAFSAVELTDKPEERNWWHALVDAEAEARVSKPRERALEEAGPIDGTGLGTTARFVLKSGPLRIDLVLQPGQSDATSRPDHIGKLPDAATVLLELGKRWLSLESVPPLKRLALGFVLLHTEASAEAGYRQLADYLHDVRIDPASRDFFYQINHPRRSQAGVDVLVNRLSKWSVGMLALIQVAPSIEKPVATSFATRLELDINTSADRSEPLPRETLPALLEEFVGMAREIASEGDVR